MAEGYSPENTPPAEGEQAVKACPPGKIRKMWDEGTRDRSTIDQEAWENIAFIKGEHWSQWDSVTKRFVKPDGKDGRTRLRVNLLKALWRSEVAILMEAKPIPEVLPVTQEETDEARARAANRILDHELHRMDWEDIKSDLLTWVTSAGYAFLHITWDKNADNVCMEVVPHFELVVDPSVRRSTKEATWVIHGRVLSKADAETKFGRKFEAKTHFQPLNFHRMFATSVTNNTEVEGVLVLRMWHKPTREYPEGFVSTIVNDGEFVDTKPWPFDHKDLPFVDLHHIRLPGRYEGQAMVTDLIAPQKDYNATRSRMAELRALLTAPKLLAPESSVDEERISNIPGEVITYRPVGPYKPEWQTPPSVPSFLFSEAEQAFSEMQDIASQHEASRGQVPSSGIPAAGIAALQEKDERRISVTVRQLESGIIRVGLQILSLVRQFWTTQKMVRVWSEKTGEMSVELFAGTDIPEQFDIRIVPGSGLPKSKTQLRQDLLALWDRRVIQDPVAILKTVDLPATSAVFEAFDLDTKQAKREHDRIWAEEGVVVAEDWHNHDIHIAEHNSFRKTETFEQEWQPEQKAALNDHVVEHNTLLQQKLMEQAQQAMLQQVAMGGEEGGEGMPAPPTEEPQI